MCKKQNVSKTEKDIAVESCGCSSMFSKDNWHHASGIVCLVIGLLSYLIEVCLYFFGNCSDTTYYLQVVFEKIGDVLLIGAVLGYISNAAMYMGIFTKELEKVVLKEEFIERLKPHDISGLWERITKKLFQYRFEGISSELLSLIKDNYLPAQRSIYYSNYKSKVTIEWIDRDKEVIKVTSNNHFKMITESSEKFTIPWKSWTRVGENSDVTYSMKIVEYVVDGKKSNVEMENLGTIRGEQVYFCNVTLEGKREYDVENVIEKTYSLREDFNKCFRAGYIVKNYTLAISHPNDMMLQFASRGTCSDFEVVSQTSNNLTAQYDGLILPRQGYVISIRLKKN